MIDNIWDIYDDDASGALDHGQTYRFVVDYMEIMQTNIKLSPEKYDEIFEEFDDDNSGTIDKEEMFFFINRLNSDKSLLI